MEFYYSENKTINERVKNEINEQLLFFSEAVYNLSFSSFFSKLKKDILGNKKMYELYNSKDAEELLLSYESEIKRLRKLLFSDTDSDEMIIAKACEYLRLVTFKDNLIISEKSKLDGLNKSSICPLFVGKGNESAQVRLLRDLLPTKMDSIISRVYGSIKGNDHEVLITKTGDRLVSIDIANYNGTSASLSNDYSLDYYSENVKPVDFNDKFIQYARKEVFKSLISELKIDEISKLIINDSMSPLDKQYAIMGYISTRLVHYESEISFNIACINDRFIEVGKLMELFFAYNNISYNMSGDTKENSIYEVLIDNENYKLDPKEMYNSNYNAVTDYLHYTGSDDNKYYLALEDEVKYRNSRTKIDRGILVGTYANEEIFNEGVKKSLVG